MATIRARRFNWKAYFTGPLGTGRRVLAVVGLVGIAAICGSLLEQRIVDAQNRELVKTPCYMEASTISREAGRNERFLPVWHYVPTVKYRYTTTDNTVLTGTVVSSRQTPMLSHAAAEEFQQKFGPGMMTHCYIAPDDPETAMLILPHDGNVEIWRTGGGIALALSILGFIALQFIETIETRPRTPKLPRAPGWGEIDSGPRDALARTRGILREKLER